jgi:hypothetical protein
MAVHTNDHLYSSLESSKSTPECNMCPYRIIPRYRSLLVVGGTDDNVERDGWSGSYSRHHDQQPQAELMNALMSDGTPCVLLRMRDTEDVLRGDVRNAAHRYQSVHLRRQARGLHTVGVSISSSLHASISDAIIIPRFDMTVGAIFPRRWGYAFLPIAQEWRNGIFILSFEEQHC